MDRQIVSILRKINCVEWTAVQIYRWQVWRFSEEWMKENLRKAAANEQTHIDNSLSRLKEIGSGPSPLRFAFYLMGIATGLLAAILGKTVALKSDILFEKDAVKKYTRFVEIAKSKGDTKTAEILDKNRADEQEHINRWQSSLEKI